MNSVQRFKHYLEDEAPSSRHQARFIRLYHGWGTLSGSALSMAGISLIVLLILIAIFADYLAPQDWMRQDLTQRLLPPNSAGHLLGTDSLGRDILSRIIEGSRVTLFIVFLVVLIAPVVGLLVGTVAGYVGGLIDTVLMRVTDVFLAFPRLILALAFVSALGSGIENAVLAISLTAWPVYARLARAETLSIRNCDFIKAIRLQGAGPLRIIVLHIWPLCLSSVIVRVTLDMASILLTAAGLGFLGLGAQPPSPEWGAMISEGRIYALDYWWIAAMPGLAVLLVSLAFNLLGDGLRDVLDPKIGGR